MCQLLLRKGWILKTGRLLSLHDSPHKPIHLGTREQMSAGYRLLEDKDQPSPANLLDCRGRRRAVRRNSLSRIPPPQPWERQGQSGAPPESPAASHNQDSNLLSLVV
ncbi:UNVERIFIED_CONTAM: hypothetical protein FKN15_065785 [Acipenser sinensis]